MVLTRLLTLLLAFLSIHSNLYINMGQDALVISEDLRLLTEPGVYSQAYPLGDTGFCVLREKQSGYCMITDSLGNPLSGAVLDDVRMCLDNIIVRYGGAWGLCDRALNLLTGIDYTAIFPVGDRFFAFRSNLWDDKADELYLLDSYGAERSTGIYLLYTDLAFSDGLCACISAETGHYGYLNSEGAWLNENDYLWAGEFVSGVAAVQTQEGCGLIDRHGDWILSPVYEQLTLSERYVLCRDKGGALRVYTRTSDGLIPLQNLPEGYIAQIGEALCLYGDEYVYLISSSGQIRAVFANDTLLYEGFGSQVIAVDTNGTYIYDAEKAILSDFFDGASRLRNAEMYVFLRADEEGELRYGALSTGFDVLLEAEYDFISAPLANMLAARRGETVSLYLVYGSQAVRIFETQLLD